MDNKNIQTVLIVFFLFMGLSVSGSKSETLALFFLISYLLESLLDNHLPVFGRTMLAFIFMMIFRNFYHVAVSDLAGFFLVGFLVRKTLKKYEEKTPWLLVLPIVLVFISVSLEQSSDVRRFLSNNLNEREPMTDMGLFINTHYKMKGSGDYYLSYRDAFVEHPFFNDNALNLVWNWRLPVVFYLWWLFGGSGVRIYFVFLLLSVVLFFCVDFLMRSTLKKSVKKFSLLSSYLIYPYMKFANESIFLTHMEWWAMFAFFIGICCIFVNKKLLSLLFFSASVGIRELMLIPIGVLWLLSFVFKKKEKWVFWWAGIFFLLLMIVHTINIDRVFPLQRSMSIIRPKVHTSGFKLIENSMNFGMKKYVNDTIDVNLILYFFALWGYFTKINWRKTLMASLLLFPIFFLRIGGDYDHVWGIMYVPMILTSSIWVFDKFAEREKTQKIKAS